MKTILVISALVVAVPSLAGAQASPSPVKPNGGSPHVQGPAHDPWDEDAASPNRNLSDAIGSTWKGPPCGGKDGSCPAPASPARPPRQDTKR